MKKRTVLKICAGLGGALVLMAALATVLVMTQVLPSPLALLRPGPRQRDMVIDKAVRSAVLDGLVAKLNANYIFPEQAQKMQTLLRARQQAGAYDAISSAEKFAATLTDDIQQINHDLHLQVSYSEETIPEFDEHAARKPTAKDMAEFRRLNFGVDNVKRLAFNIGYIKLDEFAPVELVASRFAAAMTLMADTESLIIDLRENHGGEPEAVALLASYFFDERTHLTDIYFRAGNRTQEFWSSDSVAGPKYGSKRKLYLLISNDTFSAGEGFAYTLKTLKRATLIGASTGGGAHPGDSLRLTAHFAVNVPNGRSISPVTHTNWEGVGVQPDVVMSADDALDHAQFMILKDRLLTEKDDFIRGRIEANLADLE